MHICVHEYMSTDALGCQRKGVRSLGTRIRSNCYLPDVGTGNQTWVLCKSSTSFQWQTQLQILRHGFPTYFLFLPQQPAPCNKKVPVCKTSVTALQGSAFLSVSVWPFSCPVHCTDKKAHSCFHMTEHVSLLCSASNSACLQHVSVHLTASYRDASLVC